jgi:hypothetical protein
MTPQQMFMLQQMQQAGQVAPTPTVKAPMIAAGPAPVQVQPAKELQIQQPQETEAEKFKSAAKLAALNAGMSNAFKAGATKAAMTNPMAAPLAVASMFLKEGDKVPEYEQQTFRGQPIDWSNPWEYVGMDKQTAMDPSSFSTKFARKSGGQDFSTEGPGVGSERYIPELDMNNWQKYGYDYGKIKEMFLDNPDNRTSENYQAFLWSHMSPAQKMKAIQEGGLLSGFAIKDLQETGKDEAWQKYIPQDVQFDGPFDPMGPKPDLYYSKGNKVGYYDEGEEVQGGTPWWRLGPLARLFGGFGKSPKSPLTLDTTKMDNRINPTQPEAAQNVNKKLKKILQHRAIDKVEKQLLGDQQFRTGPSKTAFERHLDDLTNKLSPEKYKEFMDNWHKLDGEGQDNWLKSREAEWEHEQKNKRAKEYVKSLETEKAVRKDLKSMSNPEAQLYTEDGKPVKGSDLMTKNLENYTSNWNKFKRGITKFAAPLAGPVAWPLAAAGTVLDASPLNPEHDYEVLANMKTSNEGPIIPVEDQEELQRQAFIKENNPQPVYKQHGGGALDNAIDYFNNYNWRTQGQPSMMPDQPYFQNISSSSDDNSSFTDQVMGGNVNLWGSPLSVNWNHGFGGQVGVGMDVPLMGGRPQWQ